MAPAMQDGSSRSSLRHRLAQGVCQAGLLVGLLLLLVGPEPAHSLRKGMFKRKDRGGDSGGSGSGDGPLGRSWPWDSLNASELENRSYEYQIKAAILDNYQKISRPVFNDTEPVVVFVGFSLFHILDTDEKYQTMKSLISIRLSWTDQYLQWEPEEFGNTTKIWISASNLWLPDILISNYADDDYRETINTNAIVSHNGHVLWMYPMVTKTYCEFNIGMFPFDSQVCNVSFYSWTFGGSMLDLHIDKSQTNNNFYNPDGQEWFVERITNHREVAYYVCCSDHFPKIHYGIHMRRRSLFYMVNLIFPCLLIYCCSFLGFFLPVESGEKVNLEITILLALVVFLIIAGEVLPPTPDVVPILGLLYGTSMLMVSVALVMAVIVTNLYSNAERQDTPVPPRLLRLSRLVLFSLSIRCSGGGACGSRAATTNRLQCRHQLNHFGDDSEDLTATASATKPVVVSPLQRSMPASARNLMHMATHDQQPFGVGSNCANNCNSRYGNAKASIARSGSPPLIIGGGGGGGGGGRTAAAEVTSAAAASAATALMAAETPTSTTTCFCTVQCETLHSASAAAAASVRAARTSAAGDWQLVSMAADRVFFWLFLAGSCLLQAYIFSDVSIL